VSLSLEPGLWLCLEEERRRSGDLEEEGGAGDRTAGLRCTALSIVVSRFKQSGILLSFRTGYVYMVTHASYSWCGDTQIRR
jgi:hypothetical protein